MNVNLKYGRPKYWDMKLRKLKETLVGTGAVNNDKNETAFAELIQFLDERSLSLVIREAKDDG